MGEQDEDATGLLESARRGERDALGALFDRYRNYVDLLARMSLPDALRAKVDASDLVQEVFLRAQQSMTSFRGRSEREFAGWLRQILVNELRQAHRRFVGNQGRCVDRERSIEEMVRDSSSALQRPLPSRGTSPSRGAQRREEGAVLADALAALEPDDRDVIVLRSLEERAWDDVAERMGRHPEAVRALWGRAIRRLTAQLEERGCSGR